MQLSEALYLFNEGRNFQSWRFLGAHPGAAGTTFRVWAPNAGAVSVVGDFNDWRPGADPLRPLGASGVWEATVAAAAPGHLYRFFLVDRDSGTGFVKADPYARGFELRPGSAAWIVAPTGHAWGDSDWLARRAGWDWLHAPVNIYEVHAGSWMRHPDGRPYLWRELAERLIPYAVGQGYTHLELLPVTEHPLDESWGYQTTGYFASTSRYGSPDDLRAFIDACHQAGLGVLLDWVPAHFPTDEHGLARFDGTPLYEYADPREGFHNDWNTLIYNFGRTEVQNFLVGSALYWLERYDVDGLRVDAVASMLYRDYSRKPGEWLPNKYGGRENLEAIAFLKRANEVVGVQRPQAVTLAEESTAFPAVSRPTYAGGLGFHYKWNMGWMHDTLAYMARDPAHRKYHHGEMSFGLMYAFNENFVLPLSHDEVVHGKGSMLDKMPGDRWQKFANLRAYYGFMFGHPGKKLLFMGNEFAQQREWDHDRSLDWHLNDDPLHAGMQALVRDLNHLLRDCGSLHQRDFAADGFEWVSHSDAAHSVLSFVRRSQGATTLMLVVCNFTPVVRLGWRVGVPRAGRWRERLNTDSHHYGGSNVGTALGLADSQPVACNDKADSILIDLPPLATVMFEWAP